MFYDKSHTSYPGELPDLDYQVISLRTQLRLNYETYRWVRALTWMGLFLLTALLALLPGGFPPRVAVLFWQTLPVFGVLLKLHGSAAFFALLVLGLQSLAWLVFWVALLTTCYRLGRYTWYLHRARVILNDGWLSSGTALDDPRRDAETTPMLSDDALAPVAPTPAATTPVVPQEVRSTRTSPVTGVSFKQPISLPSISPVQTMAGMSAEPGTGTGDFSLDRFLVAVGGTPAPTQIQAQTGMDSTWWPSRPNWTSGETKSSTTKGRS